MTNEMENKLLDFITEQLEKDCTITKRPNGTYQFDIYTDYNDRLDNASVVEILEAEHPQNALYDNLDDIYSDYAWELRLDYAREIYDKLESADGLFPEGVDSEAEDFLTDFFDYYLNANYPESHYLEQKYKVPIIVDTSDGNYDFTLNSGHISKEKERIYFDSRASIVWLAKQQGYTKSQLTNAINEDKNGLKSDFLTSVYEEFVNISSHINALTFMVEMSLGDLIKVNELIKFRDSNGYHYDATENPYCGYIVIDKKTQTGFFDAWSGAGSIFDIKLEKDVKLPVKFIHSCLPDGTRGYGYGVDAVYGFCDYVWTRGNVKTIHAPKRNKDTV